MAPVSVRIHLLILICVFLWGTSYVAIKIALSDFNPIQLAAYRFSIASVVLIPIVIARKPKIPGAGLLLAIGGISCVGIVGYQIVLNEAIQYHAPSLVSFVSNSVPVFVSIIGVFFLSERQGKRGWAGLSLGLTGIFTMNAPVSLGTIDRLLFLLLCPISAAIFYMLQKPLMKYISGVDLMMYQIIFGGIILFMVDHSFVEVIFVASTETGLAAIYLGLVPTSLAFLIWAVVLSATDVTYATNYFFLIPISTMLVAFFYYGDIPSLQELVGGSLILFGVGLVRVSR